MANNKRSNNNTGADVVTVVPRNPVGNETDPFTASYADPSMLAPDWGKIQRAAPFDSQPPSLINQDASQVDPLAGIETVGFAPIQVQNIESDLLAIRAEMPFLVIEKTPRNVWTAFLVNAGDSASLTVPTGAILAKVSGPGDFYLSFGGKSLSPTAVLAPGGVFTDQLGGFYVSRQSPWYYIGGLKELSIAAVAANSPVTVQFINRPSPAQGF